LVCGIDALVRYDAHMDDLTSIVRAEIDANGGRITLARFMELALYHPDLGYYLSAERRPGRGGDFLTSPEASPLFGITIARQIVEFWERMGRPADFSIREYGSGVGGLAYDILAGLSDAAPELFASVTYRLVERNRNRQAEALTAFRDVGLIDHIIDESDTSLEPISGVILANEVSDAFPAHRLIFEAGRFREAWVVATDDGFRFEDGPVSAGGEAAVQQLIDGGVVLVEGGVYDVSPDAAVWFQGACGHLKRGYALVIDYGYEAPELYRNHRLAGTLRGYFEHTVTDDPLTNVGNQDLTVHVDFSALRRAGETAGLTFAGLTTQGAFLAGLGLGDHLTAMQAESETTMSEYLATQAVVARLIDPGGLGRFRILIMARDAPTEPPLRGFSVRPPSF
jgi:SAM-dependent MidA family methyltransferase